MGSVPGMRLEGRQVRISVDREKGHPPCANDGGIWCGADTTSSVRGEPSQGPYSSRIHYKLQTAQLAEPN